MRALMVVVSILSALPTTTIGQVPTAIDQFIRTHCVDCHLDRDSTGGIQFDDLGFDLNKQEIARRWILIHDRVATGEMPPANTDQLDAAATTSFLKTLGREIQAAEKNRSDVVLRRLNRHEYQNTVRDLFQTNVLVNGLPEDTSTDGYDTVGEGLAMSAEAMQTYLDTADQVLDAVFGPPTKPSHIRHETNLLDQVDWKGRPQLENQIGKMFRRTEKGLVIFQSNYCPTNLVNFSRLRAPAGTYRGTLQVRAIQSDQPVTLRIYGGDTIVNRREQHLVGYFDVPPNEWTTIEFVDRLVEDGGTFLPKCYGTRDTRNNANTYPEPGIEIGDILIEGPLEKWPPPSRAKLLGNINTEIADTTDAERILTEFLPRAFRRPIQSDEPLPYIKLFNEATEAGRDFESALRVSLKAVLCSPEFLFLEEAGPAQISLQEKLPQLGIIPQRDLATRLSYFLWSTMPDEELMHLVEQGQLRSPETLHQQVERMLESPKATAFTENFTGQWLDLRDIDFTEPDPNLYPEYDELLRISMMQETKLFFEHLLKNDLPVTRFVDSDFTFLNHRLASHYGIEGVLGQEFRHVRLPVDSPRGGLLTQASILKITANGTYTSPVLRGVWILNNILGTPTPPPPDNVGSVEPDIRGASTIREQLAQHQDLETCAACHSKIDPLGFGLESFDPIGGLRTHYRTTAQEAQRPKIKQAAFTNAWVRYRIGSPVDSLTPFDEDSEYKGVRNFKQHLASQPDQIARNLARHLLTYALGRKIGFADRAAVETIVQKTSQYDYGFRSLIHQIVKSPTFQKP
ncbi:MAG: DUF1592 domain-containing protein [Rubripirellula sp.]|nr:DUF1592 domain-containing protein [Rubripirellula sp.]